MAASWQASKQHSEGVTEWEIDNLTMTASVENSINCTAAGYCINWGASASMTFYNATGKQVAKITPARITGAGDPNSISWSWRTAIGTAPISATKATFSWTVWVTRRDNITFNAWSSTKTVTLATT